LRADDLARLSIRAAGRNPLRESFQKLSGQAQFD